MQVFLLLLEVIISSPGLLDIDGDNILEFFIGSSDGYLYGLKGTGLPLQGWPVQIQAGSTSTDDDLDSSVALGNVLGDNTPEIFIGSDGGVLIPVTKVQVVLFTESPWLSQATILQ